MLRPVTCVPSALYIFSTLAALTLLCPAHTAAAPRRGKAKKTACAISFLPFSVGTKWTYNFEPPTDEAIKNRFKLKVDPPEQIVIEVVSITPAAGGAKIELKESHRQYSQKTLARCNKRSLTLSPQSFLWTGEPGGGINMEMGKIKRNGPSYPRRLKTGLKLREEIAAPVTNRGKSNESATEIEIERYLRVGAREVVDTLRAFRVTLELAGRARVPNLENASRELAAGSQATLWFSPGVGLVKVENRFGHVWRLEGT